MNRQIEKRLAIQEGMVDYEDVLDRYNCWGIDDHWDYNDYYADNYTWWLGRFDHLPLIQQVRLPFYG